MKIKCLNELFLGEFVTLMENGYLTVEKGEDSETYDIELDIDKHPEVSVMMSYANQNNVIVLTFIDTRPYQTACFAPVTINLCREDYVIIELR